MPTRPVWKLAQIIDQLDSDLHWDTGATTTSGRMVITYTLDAVARNQPLYNEYASQGIVALSSPEVEVKLKMAFEAWDDLIAPTLLQSHDRNANISVNYTTTLTEVRSNAQRYSTEGDNHRIEAADIWLQTTVTTKDGTVVDLNDAPRLGTWLYYTYVHEIGHALGLDHPTDYASPSAPIGNYHQDTQQYSIMSYISPSEYSESEANYFAKWDGTRVEISPQTPMLHDIAAVQAMYGADLGTRTGNTVYGFHSSFSTDGYGSVYNFTVNKNPVLTIYDAGGNDTFDVSGFTQSQIIDLRPGQFSSIGGLKNNVAMAFNATSGPDGHPNFNPKAVIENAVGGSGADTFYGNDANNVLTGNDGADTFYGGRGADTMSGGEGDDILDGGLGADTMFGGAGNDTYIVDSLNDVVDEEVLVGGMGGVTWQFYTDAGGDRDLVKTSLSRYDLTPLSHNAVSGSLGGQVSGPEWDLTYPTARVYGIVENLTYTGTGSFRGRGNAADNIITGGAGGDTLYGLDGQDTLYGLGGSDTLDGGSGGDTMVGGADNDTYIVDSRYDVVDEEVFVGGDVAGAQQLYVDAGGNQDLVLTSLSIYDLAPASHNPGFGSVVGEPSQHQLYPIPVYGIVENLTYTGTGSFHGRGNAANNIITGGAKDDILEGGAGQDTLYGLGGSDTLRGGAGNDVLAGGAGADTYDYADGWGRDTIIGFEPGVDIINMEAVSGLTAFSQLTITGVAQGARIVFGGNSITLNGIAASQLTATSFQLTSVIDGGQSADTLVGNNGRNHIRGFGGDDSLTGNGGADILDGGTGTDTANYAGSLAGVSIDLATGTGHGGDAEGDTLISIERVIGSAFDDTFRGGADRGQFLAGDGNDMMIGGSNYDWLEGGNGDDTFVGTGGAMVMFGGAGDDRMTGSLDNTNYFDGGTGNDTMVGGNSTDYMADVIAGDDIMHGGAGADTLVDLYGVTQLFGDDGDDFVTAAGGSGVLNGGGGKDYVTVANGDYFLFGGSGDDTLEAAGYGSHTFTGGAGADIFTYRVGGDQPRLVTDFEDGIDSIYLWDHHYYGAVPFDSLTIADSAAGAVVSWNGGSQMVFAGIAASQLTQADFFL